MAANMWKNSLKNAKSDNNKILYTKPYSIFLQRNGTYFLNKPRISTCNWSARATTRSQGLFTVHACKEHELIHFTETLLGS